MWQDYVLDFTSQFQHPAWGVSHYKRVYELSYRLANGYENVDMESLFAAAYLHDMGAFPPYKQEGIDHAERSVQAVGEILRVASFPEDKVPMVKDMIRGHMFYERPSKQLESIIFHDADTLEFMGAIGIVRLLSIVGRDDWTPDTESAIGLIKQFSIELMSKLNTPTAKNIGLRRQEEMKVFLEALSEETLDFVNM
ncbi:putative hydrolase [Peptococcaceae bacterium CEB3]|nr:putative hydrolase [Peptococcaceae bacterium CEB3]